MHRYHNYHFHHPGLKRFFLADCFRLFDFYFIVSHLFGNILLKIKIKYKDISHISLPNDKILALNQMKAVADDKSNVANKMISVCDRVENIVGKGHNAGYQHFLLFPQCFQKPQSC